MAKSWGIARTVFTLSECSIAEAKFSKKFKNATDEILVIGNEIAELHVSSQAFARQYIKT